MTVSSGVVYAGENLYSFDSMIAGEQGDLAKFSCSYCGTGDYILAPAPAPIASDDPLFGDGEPFTFQPSPGGELLCCEVVPEPDNSVPEPATAVLFGLAMMLGVLIRRVQGALS